MGNISLVGSLVVERVGPSSEPCLKLRYWSPTLKRPELIDWPVETALTHQQVIRLGWLSNLLNGIAIVVKLDPDQVKQDSATLGSFLDRHRAWRVEQGLRNVATVSTEARPPRMVATTTTGPKAKAKPKRPAAKPSTTAVRRAISHESGRRPGSRPLEAGKLLTTAAEVREMVKAG